MEVLDQGIKVEAVELLRVVELGTHGIGQGRVLVKNLQVQLIRPPVCVRGPSHCVSASAARHWALGFCIHVLSDPRLYFDPFRQADASAPIDQMNLHSAASRKSQAISGEPSSSGFEPFKL